MSSEHVSGYTDLTVWYLFTQTVKNSRRPYLASFILRGLLGKCRSICWVTTYKDLPDVKFTVSYFFFNIDTFF